MLPEGWCYDTECDDLYLLATKCWYGKFKSLDGTREMSIFPFRETVQETYDKIREWVWSFPDGALVVGFNHLGYDNWILWKMFDIVPQVGKNGKDWLEGKHVQFVDGYVLSMYINPDSPKHSLAYLSSGSDVEDDESKIDYRQQLIDCGELAHDAPKGAEFKQYNDKLIPYCDRDVDATIAVVRRLWAKAVEMYGKENWIHPSFRQMQKDYWLYSAQAYTGKKFHVERAKALVAKCEEEMEKLRQEVEPHLPPRPLKASEQSFYKMPAKPFNKAGEIASSLVKWIEKHKGEYNKETNELTAYGITTKLVANEVFPVTLPMEIDDSSEMKDYFMQAGWQPSEDNWNFKRGADGKPIRDENRKFIKTTPKIQNAGQICPNLLEIEGEIPKKVVRFLSYRNRLGVVQGWLNNWRIAFDGRLSAEISGYAPTSRVKHRTLTNVPKAAENVLLGAEMRDLFTVEEGMWFLGTDAAALENRTLASYTFPYDNGKFAKIQLEGDPHGFSAFAFFPKLHKDFDIDKLDEIKEHPVFKVYRAKGKTGNYLLAFGGGAGKLASSLGLSQKEGKAAYDNYWKQNEGLGKLKEAVEKYFDTTGRQKYIPAKDGRLVSVRAKNVLLSCLGQGLGAISMSYAGCFMDTWLGDMYLDDLGRPYYLYKGKTVKRVSQIHDEYSWEVEDGIQEEIKEISVEAIRVAGRALKLAIPLEGEGKMSYEGSWKDVH